jgi:pimeloyl-ACP methyl ester carboxylesterase
VEIKEGFIAYKNSQIEYRRLAGNTEKIIILFHGFGDKAFLFDPILPVLAKKYDAWAVSFPYHGKTDWKEGKFYKEDLAFLINKIREITGKNRLSLLGYSMGGKIVLNMLQDFAKLTDEVILLAPDGIRTHKLYDIHALPLLFIEFFKFLMKRPKLFFKTAKLFHEKGLLTKFLYDFTKNHFGTPEQRQRFFMVYESLRAFKPDLVTLKKQLIHFNIPIYLFLGERDEVILPATAEALSHDLPNCRVTWLDKGHLLIDEDLVAPLGNSLGIV